MPSYQNFNPESKFISKELLNKNRVLTMSNNRKCDYLIVDVGRDSTTMMAINNQGNSKDILVIKTFISKSFAELVDEAYWLCCEFGIQIILADNRGLGLSFIEQFEANIKKNHIQIRAFDGIKINQFININEIINDLNNGVLRFLQSPELAKNTYIKPFLGLSNIIEYHKETSKLIDEINNLEVKMRLDKIVLSGLDETIGKGRLNCLLAFYSYPMNMASELEDDSKGNKARYDVAKRSNKYEIIHGVFYKYMFKCIENKHIKVIFYHNGNHKIQLFQDITEEEQFRSLFLKVIKSISKSKDCFEIIFHNGSIIQFMYASDNARGYRSHYAVVDTEIDRETFDNVIRFKTMLFDIEIENSGGRTENIYNIDYIEM